MGFPIPSLGSLATGFGQVLSRTLLLQTNGPLGIPIPLAVLDVVKEERIDYEADISEHPVEAGMEVTDHVQLKNPMLRLKGTISSTPLDLSIAISNIASGALAAITSSQARSNLLNSGLSQGVGLVGAALQGKAGNVGASLFAGSVDAISRTILLSAYEAKTPFSVVTKRATYSNLVIQRLSFPRTEDTGYALDFEMDLKQLRIVAPLQTLQNQLDESVISSASSMLSIGGQSTQAVSPNIASAAAGSSLSASPGVSGKSPGFFA